MKYAYVVFSFKSLKKQTVFEKAVLVKALMNTPVFGTLHQTEKCLA